MEYFCSEGDDLWEMSNAQLIELASEEILRLHLGVQPGDVIDGCVIRQYKAYPVLRWRIPSAFAGSAGLCREFRELADGRAQRHAPLQQPGPLYADGPVSGQKISWGEQHNLWNVNVERSYHENFTNEEWSRAKQPSQPAAETVSNSLTSVA